MACVGQLPLLRASPYRNSITISRHQRHHSSKALLKAMVTSNTLTKAAIRRNLVILTTRRKALDTSTHSRIPSLDGLRALSIALVLIAHFSYSNGSPIRHSALMDVYAHYGVRIFLVLSGYLITTLLRREQETTGTINLRRFYVRRAYRLMPAAYLYLIVITVVFHQSLPHKYLVAAYL